MKENMRDEMQQNTTENTDRHVYSARLHHPKGEGLAEVWTWE